VLVLAGCGGSTAGPASSVAPDDGATGTVTVFAAASLSDAFETVADGFRREHPDVEVAFSFAGSSALAAQIVSGAPADVFAAASPATMRTVTDARAAATEPAVFARNRLQLVVPAGNPAGVQDIADLADESLVIALCAPQVPCGSAAETVLASVGVTAAPDTLEQDVRAVLSKVLLGEVDAALVYRTDVLFAGDRVEGIDIPEAADVVSDYPVVVLRGAPNDAAAHAFVEYVLSQEGQRVLNDTGFDA
jgi:molybdate transport system substrate-binding protein